MNLSFYEKNLKLLDQQKLLEAVEIGLALEKKYWKWYINNLSQAIEKSDSEIFDMLKIFQTQNYHSKDLKSLQHYIKSNQWEKFLVSASQDLKSQLDEKISNNIESNKITSKIGVKIQSQNLGFQRNLEDDLEKLLG